MLKVKKDLEKKKASSMIESWCSVQASSDISGNASSINQHNQENFMNELNFDDLALKSNEVIYINIFMYFDIFVLINVNVFPHSKFIFVYVNITFHNFN